jgi:hypothetical protein
MIIACVPKIVIDIILCLMSSDTFKKNNPHEIHFMTEPSIGAYILSYFTIFVFTVTQTM